MKINSLEAKAHDFARKAHEGQFRRDGATPYFSHVAAVADLLKSQRLSEEYVAAGFLHDVCEEGANIISLYREGFPKEVVDAVAILTKLDGEEYFAYLQGVKTHELARKVKIADMICNLTDAPTEKQRKKYREGLAFLTLSK